MLTFYVFLSNLYKNLDHLLKILHNMNTKIIHPKPLYAMKIHHCHSHDRINKNLHDIKFKIF